MRQFIKSRTAKLSGTLAVLTLLAVSFQNFDKVTSPGGVNAGATEKIPDLYVESFRLTRPKPSHPVSLRIYIKNQGTADSNPTTVTFKIDDQTPVVTKISKIKPKKTSAVIIGNEVQFTEGKHKVTACVEHTDESHESDYENNCVSKTVYVEPKSPAKGANVAIRSLCYRSTCTNHYLPSGRDGSNIRFMASVVNPGTDEAASVTVRLEIDGKQVAEKSLPKVGAGSAKVVDLLKKWKAAKGNHQYSLCVDQNGKPAVPSDADPSCETGEFTVGI